MTNTCASRGCFWHAVLLSCGQKLSESCDGHLGVDQLTDQLGQLKQRHPQNLHGTGSVTDVAWHQATDGVQNHMLLRACKGLSCKCVAGTVHISTDMRGGGGHGEVEGEEEEN